MVMLDPSELSVLIYLLSNIPTHPSLANFVYFSLFAQISLYSVPMCYIQGSLWEGIVDYLYNILDILALNLVPPK